MSGLTAQYNFTNDWFTHVQSLIGNFSSRLEIKNCLEIGCFEGRSTCFFIESLGAKGLEKLVCVDSWKGGSEHVQAKEDMSLVQARFFSNVKIALSRVNPQLPVIVMKSDSVTALTKLVSDQAYRNSFELIYIDGSHEATDVMADAVLSFHLSRIGGLLIFDDYTWCQSFDQGKDLCYSPKTAIDAFVNIFFRKIEVMYCSHKTWIVKKISG